MASETTQKLKDIDRRCVWHPFTQMRDWADDDAPIIDRAHRCRLIDTDGNEYLDGISSLWVNVHGHRHPVIDAAVRGQLDRVAHSTLLGLGNVPSIELAERLLDHAPEGLSRVFYSDSGSTAVEVAIKIAFAYFRHTGSPERNVFVRFEGSYHGDTLGSVSVGGIDLFHELYRPLLFEAPVADYPHCYRCKYELHPDTCGLACLQSLDRILAEHRGRVAAVIIEPLIQGASGMRVAPQGFLREVADRAREAGALLVCDEVATGFGRTGKMFACQHEDVSPDLMALAKGISAGYLPLAATLATELIYEAFLGAHTDNKTFFHGHTYTGNPLACAAALAGLQVFEAESVLEKLTPKIELFENLLDGFRHHPSVGDVRHKGLMAGIELVADAATGRPFDPDLRVGVKVTRKARSLGAILRPLGDVMVLMPPLSIEQEELRQLMSIADKALGEVEGQYV